jgi:hypothetical protein
MSQEMNFDFLALRQLQYYYLVVEIWYYFPLLHTSLKRLLWPDHVKCRNFLFSIRIIHFSNIFIQFENKKLQMEL